MRGTDSRRLAVEVLLKVDLQSAYANLALAAAFNRKQLSERDRAFVTALVQGVVRHSAELDHVLTQLTSRPIDKLAAPLKAVLRTALFQLIHMKNIPVSAVLNTSTQVARATGHEGSAKFATAVLRRYVSSAPDAQSQPEENLVGEEALGVKYTMPEWLISRWLQRFGPEETRRLLEYSLSVPGLTLRTCQLSVRPDALQQILESKGMKIERGRLVPGCLNIIKRGKLTGPIAKIPGYAEGLFSVQDEAAALVSMIVAPQTGWAIVDLCAAPGGKSIHLAELLGNTGRITAVDIHESRLHLLPKERRRLGITNIETIAADGRSFTPAYHVDAVLVDAPCTGTGVINRRSDLRQRRQAPDVTALVQTQRELLENAAKILKPGGILVYATCSIEREENQENIIWFLDKHPEFKPQSLEGFLPDEIISQWSGPEANSQWWQEAHAEMSNGMLQLLPSRHGYSGFFISRLKKE